MFYENFQYFDFIFEFFYIRNYYFKNPFLDREMAKMKPNK